MRRCKRFLESRQRANRAYRCAVRAARPSWRRHREGRHGCLHAGGGELLLKNHGHCTSLVWLPGLVRMSPRLPRIYRYPGVEDRSLYDGYGRRKRKVPSDSWFPQHDIDGDFSASGVAAAVQIHSWRTPGITRPSSSAPTGIEPSRS